MVYEPCNSDCLPSYWMDVHTSKGCCNNNERKNANKYNTLLRVTPTLTLICHSFWHIIWTYIYIYIHIYILFNLLIFYLAFYLTFYYGIFLASILTSYLAFFVASILTFSLAFYLAFFLPYVLACYLALSDVLSGSLSGIYSDILFWHSIWYIFGDSLWLRSRGEHSDPELAVGVRRGTLWSAACGGGPPGNALILSLRWRSGGERSDPELAVEVRRGTLWSRARSWGPAGITLIQRLLFRGGGSPADIKPKNPHLIGREKTDFRLHALARHVLPSTAHSNDLASMVHMLAKTCSLHSPPVETFGFSASQIIAHKRPLGNGRKGSACRVSTFRWWWRSNCGVSAWVVNSAPCWLGRTFKSQLFLQVIKRSMKKNEII